MNSETEPIVRQQLLIRVPPAAVFRAFVDPDITTRFWFTHSTGKLSPGAQITWEWRMYGVSTVVDVLEMLPDRRVRIEWGEAGQRTQVEWTFEPRPAQSSTAQSSTAEDTLVRVVHQGFGGSSTEKVHQALDSMGGFSFLLAAAKAFLEHGVELNLVSDKAPDAHVQ